MNKWHKFPEETPTTFFKSEIEKNEHFLLSKWFLTSDQYGNLALKRWNKYHNHFMGKGKAKYVADNVFFWMDIPTPPLADGYLKLEAMERKKRKLSGEIQELKETLGMLPQ